MSYTVQQIVSIVLYSITAPIMLLFLIDFYRRKKTPFIKPRFSSFSLFSGVFSFLTITFMFSMIVIGEDRVPCAVVLFFGLFLTSLQYRPYLIRAYLLYTSFQRNEMMLKAIPMNAVASSNSCYGLDKSMDSSIKVQMDEIESGANMNKGETNDNSIEASKSVEIASKDQLTGEQVQKENQVDPKEEIKQVKDESVSEQVPKQENPVKEETKTKIEEVQKSMDKSDSDSFSHYKHRRVTKRLALVLLFASLILDTCLALFVMGFEGDHGLSGWSKLTGCFLLYNTEWVVFALFLVIYLVLMAFVYSKTKHEVYYIKTELLFCLTVYLVFGVFYVVTFTESISHYFLTSFHRYYIYSFMMVLTFFATICLPVIKSYSFDVFGDAVPNLRDEEEEASSSHNLKIVLENDAISHEFQVFLAKELSAENLFFYRMVHKYKKPNDKIDGQMRLEWARRIYHGFLEEGSPNQVNISNATRHRIMMTIENRLVDSTLFDTAQVEIFNLMEKDSFPRFMIQYMSKKPQDLNLQFINPTASSAISTIIETKEVARKK